MHTNQTLEIPLPKGLRAMICQCGESMDEYTVNSYSEEYSMYGCEGCGAFVPTTYRQITEADLDVAEEWLAQQ